MKLRQNGAVSLSIKMGAQPASGRAERKTPQPGKMLVAQKITKEVHRYRPHWPLRTYAAGVLYPL